MRSTYPIRKPGYRISTRRLRPRLTAEQNQRLLDLCTAWAEQHPSWSNRLAKARLLLIDGAVLFSKPGEWRVGGTSAWHHVKVVGAKGSCDCKWWVERQVRCSHLFAAALWHKIFSAPIPPLPPTSITAKRASHALEQICRDHEQRQSELRRATIRQGA